MNIRAIFSLLRVCVFICLWNFDVFGESSRTNSKCNYGSLIFHNFYKWTVWRLLHQGCCGSPLCMSQTFWDELSIKLPILNYFIRCLLWSLLENKLNVADITSLREPVSHRCAAGFWFLPVWQSGKWRKSYEANAHLLKQCFGRGSFISCQHHVSSWCIMSGRPVWKMKHGIIFPHLVIFIARAALEMLLMLWETCCIRTSTFGACWRGSEVNEWKEESTK